MDGWETIRRLREGSLRGEHGDAEIAIISANAFDKGMDNDVGIGAEESSPSRCAWTSCWTGSDGAWSWNG